jgi:hypothetical protein
MEAALMPRWSEVVTITLPDGTQAQAIVCGSGKRPRTPRCRCGRTSSIQCDFPLLDGKTCDQHLCRSCAVPVGRNRDYCPEHPR